MIQSDCKELLSFLFTDSSPRNTSSSSVLTDSDSESATNYLNISKSHSELSDISDGEEQTSRDHISGKTCTQRLFSPEGRAEHCLERNSSPEVPSPASFSKNDRLPECNKYETENTKANIKNEEEDQAPTCRSKATVATSNKTQNKPKIWSITEMLR